MDQFLDHFIGGRIRSVVLTEELDAVYQCSGRGGRQTVVTVSHSHDKNIKKR